jgi:4a-hydroxytetrahydrobiopterin dehydratase
MSLLASEKCVACRSDAPKVTKEEIAELLPEIPDWQIVYEGDIPQLTRSFPFRNFLQATEFTTAIASLAEEQGHHPRLVLEWRKAAVSWWTHAIRNLHRNDFIMAKKTDGVYGRYEAKNRD